MKLKHTLLFLILFCGGAQAGDTPFLNFVCTFGRNTGDDTFGIRFRTDDSTEVETWSTTFQGTKIRFEKMNRYAVRVFISTGLPLISHAAPSEYQFVAPLVTNEFGFSTGISPVSVKGELLSLECEKKKKP